MTVIAGDGRSMSIYTAKSLAEYINKLDYLRSNSKLFFRGLSDCSYELVPSIGRKIPDDSKRLWLKKESRLVEYAEQSFPGSFDKATPTMIISNMQHYGIPTRMLDITGNALIALYFACQDDKHTGEVVVFEGETVSAYNPMANIIADTYRLTQNAIVDIQTYRYLIYHQEYASTLIYPGWETEVDKDTTMQQINKPLIVDVGVLNQRQVNQDGKFILFPNKMTDTQILNELVTLNKSDSMVKSIIQIPAEKKAGIIKRLELAGITKAFVFPDDINCAIERIKESIQKEQFLS